MAQVSITGLKMPWVFTGGINSAYPYGVQTGGGPGDNPVVIALGDEILAVTIGYVSGTVSAGFLGGGEPLPYVDPEGEDTPTGGGLSPNGVYFPTKYMPGSPLGRSGLVGCWADDAGQVIEPLSIGLGGTFRAPAGATRLQLGINDDFFGDNLGSFLMDVVPAFLGPYNCPPNFERPGVVAGFTLSRGITGGLRPAITRGVLFAGGVMYRPATAPELPEMPAASLRWLWYANGSGFYYTATNVPNDPADAGLGWLRSNGTEVIAVSAQQISVPDVGRKVTVFGVSGLLNRPQSSLVIGEGGGSMGPRLAKGSGRITAEGIESSALHGDGAKFQVFTGAEPDDGELARFDADGNVVAGGEITAADVAAASLHGNGSKFQMFTGASTNGNMAVFDANGNVVDGGPPPSVIPSGGTNDYVEEFYSSPSSSPTELYQKWRVKSPDAGGGGVLGIASTLGHPGIVSIFTPGSTLGARTALVLGDFNSSSGNLANAALHSGESFDLVFVVNPQDAGSSIRWRFGLVNSNGISDEPPSNLIAFEKEPADTNLFAMCRTGGAQTRTDTGVAASASTWYTLRIRRINGTTIGFTVNGGTEIQIAANVPSQVMAPFVLIGQNGTGTRTIWLDFFSLKARG